MRAGGMGSARRESLAQRAANGQLAERQPPQRTEQHCWTLGPHGRRPGLLIGWQKRDRGWWGRVVHVEGDDVIEEWLPADRLEPTTEK